MDPSEPLLPAEKQLLDALGADKPCHLIDPDIKPTAEEMTRWADPDRKIRGEFLRPLLLSFHADVGPHTLDLRGAHITGTLDLSGTTIDPRVSLSYCRLDNVWFSGATFAGDAWFEGATFAGDARFQKATFGRNAWFGGATFGGDIRFDRVTFTRVARFDGATFTGDARFDRATFLRAVRFEKATFTGDAWFERATFAGAARFEKAMFTENAQFERATFAGEARFEKVTFTGDAGFDRATFAGAVRFEKATFTGDAWFEEAMFTGDAWFEEALLTRSAPFIAAARYNHAARYNQAARFGEATFNGRARFSGACAQALYFNGVHFHGLDLGPILGGTVDLARATFHARVRLTVLCSTMSMQDTQLRAGGRLQIHAADISAEGAEFLGPTIVADPGPTPFTEILTEISDVLDFSDKDEQEQLPLPVRVALDTARKACKNLARNLIQLADAGRHTTVTSLRTANVGNLVLSAAVLDTCRFAGAHGLDKLHIDASCRLASTPDRRPWRPWRSTRRRIIAEERDWRCRYAIWDGTTGPESPVPPPAAEIAGIYRDLRKGLEDIKNEPGAADFYYGEMEMRRLAHRENSGGSAVASFAERWLLHAYWAVCGYGLRAWRAFACVAVLILAAALVFFTVGVAEPGGTTTQANSVDLATGTINDLPQERTVDNFGDALELAGRNSIALLRNPGPVPELTTAGTVTDVLLRLLTPVLLGFALLALRGRTKR